MNVSIPIILLVVFAILAVAICIAFLIGRRSRIRSVAEPCCGRCSYPVRGLAAWTCPECGADLREVGILTPAMRRPVGPWLAIFLWTLALPIPALVITGILTSFAIPHQYSYEDTWELTPIALPGLDRVEILATAAHIRWPWQVGASAGSTATEYGPEHLQLAQFSTAGSNFSPASTLSIDFEKNTWSTADAPTDRPLTELDHNVLLDWLGGSAQDAEAQITQVAQLLDELVDSIHESPHGRDALSVAMNTTPLSSVATTRRAMSMSRVGPMPSLMIGIVIAWFVLWILGCVKLYRRQTRGSA